MGNGCGGEGGFKFSIIRDRVKKLPFVNPKKLDKCYYDIEEKACNPHDDRFKLGGGIYDFIRANYIFSLDVIALLQWTTVTGRLSIFLLLFLGTSTLGISYFNWTCLWRRK